MDISNGPRALAEGDKGKRGLQAEFAGGLFNVVQRRESATRGYDCNL